METCKQGFKNFLRTRVRVRVFTLMSWIALWMCVLTFLNSSAHAFNRRSTKKKSSVNVTLGIRYWMHYNRVTVISTPPESILGELQVSYWIKGGAFGFQLSGATAVSMSSGTYFGLGVKLQAISIQSGRASAIGGFSLILHAEGVLFNVAQPAAPQSYEPSGFLFRYGASIHWLFGPGKFYLDTTMSVSTFQNNFFIGPYVGLGVKF